MATQTNPSKTNQSMKRAPNARADNARSNNDKRGSSSGQTATSSGQTATPDATYGLVSVLYHALQGAQTYGQYIADAERAENDELVEFFQECQSQENERAARAKVLLAGELAVEDDEDEEDDDEDDEDDEDEEDEK